MKDSVIKVLKQEGKPQAQFNDLLQLFMAHNDHNYGQARFLNRAGFSKVNLDNLKYDIKKLYGIRPVDLAAPLKVEEKSFTPEQHLLEIDFDVIELEGLSVAVILLDKYSNLSEMTSGVIPPEFTKGAAGNPEMKAWLASKNVTHTLTSKKDMAKLITETAEKESEVIFKKAVENLKLAQAGILANNAGEALQQIFNDAPDDAKSGMKLREQYPFLNEDDCPDKLKILIADKITADHKFMTSREEIQQLIASDNEDVLFELAKKAVENFELNKEIKDELDYYGEHKEILGNHPIFSDENLQALVNGYKEADLKSTRANIRTYISKETKKLENAKDEDSKAVIQSKIDAHLEHIALIEVRLGADGKK